MRAIGSLVISSTAGTAFAFRFSLAFLAYASAAAGSGAAPNPPFAKACAKASMAGKNPRSAACFNVASA